MVVGGETSQTLERGIELLQLVAQSGARGMTVTELARGLGVGRPVVYRLVGTFANHDWVRRAADGRILLGWRLVGLSSAVHPVLRQVAGPILRTLADAAGATAHLTIVEGEEAVAVAVVEPTWTDLHVAYRMGRRHPLSKGAAGRAVMAARQGRYNAVTTQGELQAGASGVAAPLHVTDLEGSVGVVTVETLDESATGRLVEQAAADLSTILSTSADDDGVPGKPLSERGRSAP